MSPARRCSRTACDRPAVTTLTYVYADQTAVLGPLATYAEPHAYDLCDRHAERLSAPRGWEVLRLVSDLSPRGPSDDDLLALANAVREAARPVPAAAEPPARRVRLARDPPPRAPAGAHPRRGAGARYAPRLSAMPTSRPDTVRAVFKAYDVRGLVPEQIDEPLARATGRAHAQVTGATTVVVGHDMRPSSPGLAHAFATGATEAGADVVMIGLASTDMLYFASGHLGVAGAMFTASHNPAQYNGIKLCRANAVPLGLESGLDEIRDLVVGAAPYGRAGRRGPHPRPARWPTPSTCSRWCR